MGFRYETHLHTCEGSACASASGAEMARAYKELGYTGIFVTDHFFNGNTAVPLCLPWRERIERFCLGYEHAREEGEKIGLDVFFGFEYGVRGADFLVYNLDREWLIRHKDIDRVDPRKAFFSDAPGRGVYHSRPSVPGEGLYRPHRIVSPGRGRGGDRQRGAFEAAGDQ